MDRGHDVVSGMIQHREVLRLLEELGDLSQHRTRAGARHLMGVPAVLALANDTRLLGIARDWVGETAVLFRATLFDKSPDRNFHASSKATSDRPRRVLHLEYADSLDIAAGLRLAVV